MMKVIHYDVHVADPSAGHRHSDDCFCEPSKAYWIRGQDGRMLHVLEHNDEKFPVPSWVYTVLDETGSK